MEQTVQSEIAKAFGNSKNIKNQRRPIKQQAACAPVSSPFLSRKQLCVSDRSTRRPSYHTHLDATSVLLFSCLVSLSSDALGMLSILSVSALLAPVILMVDIESRRL